jgi:hypothetical protein
MYLDLSAMALLEHYRRLETDLHRARLEAIRREVRRSPMADVDTASDEVAGVSFGDRTSRRRDGGADLGWR